MVDGILDAIKENLNWTREKALDIMAEIETEILKSFYKPWP